METLLCKKSRKESRGVEQPIKVVNPRPGEFPEGSGLVALAAYRCTYTRWENLAAAGGVPSVQSLQLNP